MTRRPFGERERSKEGRATASASGRFSVFKDAAASIQSLVVAAGVVIGGAWTYLTYGGIEQAGSVLDIGLVAKQVVDPALQSRYLQVTATLTNRGKKIERVPLDSDPVRVFLLWPDPGSEPPTQVQSSFEGSASLLTSETPRKLSKAPSIELLPAVTKTLDFVVPIHRTGVFYVTMTLPRDPEGLWHGGTVVEIELSPVSGKVARPMASRPNG